MDGLFAVDLVINLIVGCLSLVGNGLVIATYIKFQEVRSRTTITLLSLAVIDIVMFPLSLLYFCVQLTHSVFTPELSLRTVCNRNAMNHNVDMDQYAHYVLNCMNTSLTDFNSGPTNETGRQLEIVGFDEWCVACKMVAGMSELLAVCDLLNVLIIEIERFIFIVYPLRYVYI